VKVTLDIYAHTLPGDDAVAAAQAAAFIDGPSQNVTVL